MPSLTRLEKGRRDYAAACAAETPERSERLASAVAAEAARLEAHRRRADREATRGIALDFAAAFDMRPNAAPPGAPRCIGKAERCAHPEHIRASTLGVTGDPSRVIACAAECPMTKGGAG
jgi:hypothetical protein